MVNICIPWLLVLTCASSEPSLRCDFIDLNVREDGAAERFAKELRGRHAVRLLGLVDDKVEGWEASNWDFGKWKEVLGGDTQLPLRRVSSVANLGALHAAQDVSGEAFFNDSGAGQLDDGDSTFVFSTSSTDAVMQKLSTLGVIKVPSLLSSIHLHPVLSIGGPNEGLPYHQHEEAWLALLHGAKRWFLRPAHAAPASAHTRRVSAEALAEEQGALQCTQQAGEVVYFPKNWWHSTYNLHHKEGNLSIGVGGLGVSGAVEQKALVDGNLTKLKDMAKDSDFHRWFFVEQGGVWAGRMGHMEILDWLLSLGLRIDNSYTLPGVARQGNVSVQQQLVHICAESGHVPLMKSVLKAKGNINAKEMPNVMPGMPPPMRGHALGLQQRTPLHVASDHGHVPMVKLLLEHRAKASIRTTDGMSLLERSCGSGHLDVAKWLIKQGENQPKLKTSVRGKRGDSAVVAAVSGGHLRMLNMLLDNGAELARVAHGEPNKGRPSVIHIAAANGYLEVTSWLLSQRIDIHVKGTGGLQAVHLAVQRGHHDVLSLLLGARADVRATDSAGSLPLHWAGFASHAKIVSMLLEMGAEANKKDARGQSAMGAALMGGHLSNLKVLSEAGGDLGLAGKPGTLGILASKAGHADILSWVVQQGIMAPDPSDVAQFGHAAIARYLKQGSRKRKGGRKRKQGEL